MFELLKIKILPFKCTNYEDRSLKKIQEDVFNKESKQDQVQLNNYLKIRLIKKKIRKLDLIHLIQMLLNIKNYKINFLIQNQK